MHDVFETTPITGSLKLTVPVPGSKSITNRALVLAALAQTTSQRECSVLSYALDCDDTHVMVQGLAALGIPLVTVPPGKIVVPCVPIAEWKPAADIFCGNSGTTIRFLSAMLALGTGQYRLDGVARMRERPIGDLLDALNQLGATATSEKNNRCPPVFLQASGLKGGEITLRGDISSQYLSAVLMACPLATNPTTITLSSELVSVPYVEMTLAMMRQWGVTVDADFDKSTFHIPGQQRYLSQVYEVEPDASSASYFLAAAAITGGEVTVPRPVGPLLQGDWEFQNLLVKMGCTLTDDGHGIIGGKLRGIDVDMNAISDTVMTLAVVALFAEGATTIRNVGHIRHKETDRIAALATELRNVGAVVDERDDGLTIHPRPMHAATLATYDDHRMAMSLSLIGLKVPGIRIENPGCVAKTYPGFWDDYRMLHTNSH